MQLNSITPSVGMFRVVFCFGTPSCSPKTAAVAIAAIAAVGAIAYAVLSQQPVENV